ncbi:MAG TPA: SLC13 family permease, partial [Acidimicrobiales bacterium]|nr:SLC13 family permease [Acidimicrobiales bacterium]
MAALSIVLLLAGVAGAVTRPLRLPAWAVPVAAAAIDLLAGAATESQARRSLSELGQPIGFLLAAVPLAVLLDRLGFFSAAARAMTRGRRSLGALWVLAAVVTTVLNLDASVVLLTPLYVRVARRRGMDPFLAGVQPLVLAWLA